MYTLLSIYLILFAFLNIPACYLHREITHQTVKFSPVIVNIARVMLWLRTTKYNSIQVPRIWAAIHHKHHSNPDTVRDPHSPYYVEFWDVLTHRRPFFMSEEELDTLTKKTDLTPAWVDRYLDKYLIGPAVLLVILLLIFPVWAALLCWLGVTNIHRLQYFFSYLTHKVPGYINAKPLMEHDRARNMFPIWMFVYGGEEIHGNHHRWLGRANFAVKWWEVDIMYCVVKFLSWFGLAKVLKNPPIKDELKTQFVK